MEAVSESLRSAVEHHRAGRLADAVEIYTRIIRVDPRHADANHLLGVAAHQSGDFGRAIDCIRRAIDINSAFAPFHSNLGAAYRAAGRVDEAIASYRESLARDPNSATVQFNLGNALVEKRLFEEAAETYRRAIQIDAQMAAAWNSLGEVQNQLGEFSESETSLSQALKLQPDSAEAHFNLGNTLRAQGRSAEAAMSFLRAVSMRPNYVDAHINLGCVYDDFGRLDSALAAYDRALRLDDKSPAAHFNRSLAWLRQGDFSRGWPEYEWRWEHNERTRRLDQSAWDGSSLGGRTILVYSEQGIGDEIQFSSCIPDVTGDARRCLVECDPRLVRLFARSFPGARVFARASAGASAPPLSPESFDTQIAAGSLPRFLRPSLDSFPRRRRYLEADQQQVEIWRRRYEQLGGKLTVGISWRGGKDRAARRVRSTTLDQWHEILSLPGISFVSLQYGDCRKELENVRDHHGLSIHDWSEGNPLADLDGFAARVAALDLVISVDNATVHLAGALGVRVWTLLPFASDWRWMVDVTESPWYPTMTLLRQRFAGEWSDVFQRAAAALRRIVHTPTANSHSITTNRFPTEDVIDDAESHFRLGNELQSHGEYLRAVEAYGNAIKLRPDLAKAHFNNANAWLSAGMIDAARESYQRATSLDPSYEAHAHTNLGTVLRQRGFHDDAEQECFRALESNPNYAEAHCLLGNIQKDRGCLHDAAENYSKAIELNPRSHEALNNLGTLHQGWGDEAAARQAYEKSLEMFPDYAEAHNNLGTLLHEIGDVENALTHYRRALTARPDFPAALTNLGMVLDQQGMSEEALILFDRALTVAPKLADARFYRALAMLRRGDFAEGWREYESRWQRGDLQPRSLPYAVWDGSPLNNRSIIVCGEQGVGDEVFFASCIPDLLKETTQCLIECEPRLVRLFSRSFTNALVLPRGDHVSKITSSVARSVDLQIAAGSLTRYFRRSLPDFPASCGYLIPDATQRELFQHRLESLGQGLKIGISWRGGSKPEDKRRRSTRIDEWSVLFELPGVQFINLQYGDIRGDLASLRPRALHDFDDCDPLRDLDAFAALIAALDLVISVDNSTVHFAGALGVPVWILLPWESDWRWMRGRTDSPWYRTAKLFRQPRPGDWKAVFDQLSRQLLAQVTNFGLSAGGISPGNDR